MHGKSDLFLERNTFISVTPCDTLLMQTKRGAVMSNVELYTVEGVTGGAAKPIHLVELKWILGIVINNPTIRTAMHADPAATLTKLNYIPNAKAIAFFNSLKSIDFDKAVDALITTPSDAAFNMAEL
jgi:hypothetical protein